MRKIEESIVGYSKEFTDNVVEILQKIFLNLMVATFLLPCLVKTLVLYKGFQ